MSNKSSTIGKIGQRRQVVIPKGLFDELGLREGDLVEVTRTKRAVLIKPKKLVDPDDIVSPSKAKLLRKAESQMHRGKYVTLDQLENDLGNQTRKRSRKTA
jgi:AbrB family looped-hinge helix DNA binding protein